MSFRLGYFQISHRLLLFNSSLEDDCLNTRNVKLNFYFFSEDADALIFLYLSPQFAFDDYRISSALAEVWIVIAMKNILTKRGKLVSI